MKERSVCFAGRGEISSRAMPGLRRTLDWMIEQLIVLDYTRFYCGGARGFDMLAGRAVLDLRKRYPQVKLILVLTCRDQDAAWREDERERYRALLDGADLSVYLPERQWDPFVVDRSSMCLAYLTRAQGAAARTVEMAKQAGLIVHNLAELPPPSMPFPRG